MNPRKPILVALLLFLCAQTLYAQPYKFEWVKHFGSPTNDVASNDAVVIDSNKAVITAGQFYATVDFDNGPGVTALTSNGDQDIFITEYDTAGNFHWVKQIGGTLGDFFNDMQMDPAGNIIITGGFQGTVDFDPGPGVHTETSVGANSFILMLDNNGNFKWVHTFAPFYMNALAVDASGNIITAGSFGGTVDFDPGPGTFTLTAGLVYDDIYVLKLDNAGNFIWAKQLKNQGTGYHQEGDLETAPDNSIFLCGNFSTSLDFDPGTGTQVLTPAGGNDGYLLKLDAQGNFNWVKQLASPEEESIWKLAVDNAGNVYSTGTFMGSVDFDPGPGTFILTAAGTYHSAYILKLDPAGNFSFAKCFENGESLGISITLDKSNNIYIGGNFSTDVDFDPGPGTYILSDGNLYTAKLNANGNFVWAAAYHSIGPVFFISVYSALAVDITGNVYFASAFPYTVDFDPNAPVYAVTSNGFWDGMLHKLSQCRASVNTLTVQTCNAYTLNGTTYTTSGTYYQTLVNSSGCDSIIELNLTISQILNKQTVSTCAPYVWNGTTYSSSGVYRDTFHLASGCDSIAELTLTISKIQTQFTAASCGTYIWNGKPLTATGVYNDTFHLAGGCDSVTVLNLTVKPAPVPQLGKDSALCSGATIVLSPGIFTSYLWSDNSTGSTLDVKQPGTYWVKVTGNNLCSAADTVIISKSAKCLPFYIPNAFTPNSDGKNDYFKPIINFAVDDYLMEIYNRWGEKIFSTTETAAGWDGRYKSVMQNAGGFTYTIRFTVNSTPSFYKGTFVLIH